MARVEADHGVVLDDYAALHDWSVSELATFWSTVWRFFDVLADGDPGVVLRGGPMPDVEWFPDVRLNYAEHVLRHTGEHVALVGRSQSRPRVSLTRDELREQVARVRAGLRRLGIAGGDRVAAYAPNIPETVVLHLAAASLGATFSSCAPEFGVRSVVDRLKQIEPKLLLAVTGYRYGASWIDRTAEVAAIRTALPSLSATVWLPYGDATDRPPDVVSWDELAAPTAEPLAFARVPFRHPLVILYSSGTTGLPKPIVHGHGGALLEHVKALGLQFDLTAADRYFWFTTTGWMMWNYTVAGLLTGATIVLFDGNPAHPDAMELWRLAAEERVTYFGVSAGFLMSGRRLGLQPGRDLDLSSVRTISSTGSPLPVEGYEWVYDAVKPDVQLVSGSGGTDVLSGFVGGSPLVPVYAGEISCPALGVDVASFDEEGRPVRERQGELVVRRPMPSMPVAFWGDADGSRLREAYFAHYPGVWRHGDWITITERGTFVISGRSDATLNRGGVRLGTAELYAVVEDVPDVLDSLVVYLERGGDAIGELLLFVVLEPDRELDDELRSRIASELRTQLSPRHVPDRVLAVPAVPRTLSGKKLEVPVKRILLGEPLERVANPGALADPAALDAFVALGAPR
jgi:acetoacetyl-CoA synthetase